MKGVQGGIRGCAQGNFLERKFPHTPSKNFIGQGLQTSRTEASIQQTRAACVGPFPLRLRLSLCSGGWLCIFLPSLQDSLQASLRDALRERWHTAGVTERGLLRKLKSYARRLAIELPPLAVFRPRCLGRQMMNGKCVPSHTLSVSPNVSRETLSLSRHFAPADVSRETLFGIRMVRQTESPSSTRSDSIFIPACLTIEMARSIVL